MKREKENSSSILYARQGSFGGQKNEFFFGGFFFLFLLSFLSFLSFLFLLLLFVYAQATAATRQRSGSPVRQERKRDLRVFFLVL